MKAKAVVFLSAMALAIASCSSPQTETTDTTVVSDTVGVTIDSAAVEEVKAEN